MASSKVHYELGLNRGACGYFGETTRDKKKVTCKLCEKLLRTRSRR